MTTTITDLHKLAEKLGVRLTHHTHGPAGWFHKGPPKVVSTVRGLKIWDYKTVLAHELAHAHYGDSECGHWDGRQERRANLWAARLLISPEDLHRAALWHGDDLHGIALELEVTPDLLDVFISNHRRRKIA